MKYIMIPISFFMSLAGYAGELRPERWSYDENYSARAHNCAKFDVRSVEDATRCRREILKRKVAYQRKLKSLHEQREQLFWESMSAFEAEEIRAILSGERDDELE